jgi:hypothetical protein
MGVRTLLAAIVALACLCLSGAAEANGRAGPAVQSFAAPVWHQQTAARTTRHSRTRLAWAPRQYAPDWQHGAPTIAVQAAWGGGSALVAEAAHYVGSGKFTPFVGPWCADAVSFWLRATGKPPLANRMAGAALSYGPRGSGAPSDLAVFMGRHGAYHVGVVVPGGDGAHVKVVSGNWGHRVGRAFVSRRSLIFVRT